MDLSNPAPEPIIIECYKKSAAGINAAYRPSIILMLWTNKSEIMEQTLTTTKAASSKDELPDQDHAKAISDLILNVLEEHSAQDTLTIDIKGKSSVADIMIVTCGRSNRHVGALADYVVKALKEAGHRPLGIEGQIGNDWVLVDIGDVILHIFRPEVRAFYNLEKIWSVPLPESIQNIGQSFEVE